MVNNSISRDVLSSCLISPRSSNTVGVRLMFDGRLLYTNTSYRLKLIFSLFLHFCKFVARLSSTLISPRFVNTVGVRLLKSSSKLLCLKMHQELYPHWQVKCYFASFKEIFLCKSICILKISPQLKSIPHAHNIVLCCSDLQRYLFANERAL